MKLNRLLSTVAFFTFAIIQAQETSLNPSGKVTGKVSFNYHFNTSEGAQQKSAFELKRSYLGYKYKFDNKFSASILLDAGNNSEGSSYTVFVKNAKVDYKLKNGLVLTAGIFGLKQFKDQEKFWGYRYIYKSFNDENKFGSSADLGFMATAKFNKYLKMNLLMVNGEGYKSFQDDSGNMRYGANLVYTPSSKWVFKAYYDRMNEADTRLSNLALFAGYKMSHRFRIGGEYNLLKNGENYKRLTKNKDLKGLSFYSTFMVNKKWNVFARYDQLSSNKLLGKENGWNYNEDATTIITGVECKPIKGVKTSLNYRIKDFEDSSQKNVSAVYFNLSFYF